MCTTCLRVKTESAHRMSNSPECGSEKISPSLPFDISLSLSSHLLALGISFGEISSSFLLISSRLF